MNYTKEVYNPEKDRSHKPKDSKLKTDEPAADEPLHAEAAKEEEPVTEFKVKLNKYGFIHVPKKALPSLPFKAEEPLKAKITDNTLIITKA